MNRSKRFKEYELKYSQRELDESPGLDHSCFIEPREVAAAPFIYLPSFLGADELRTLYHSALLGFESRVYATVHDYSAGVEAAKVDTSGRYTHNVRPEPKAYELLERLLRERIYPLLTAYYEVGESPRYVRSEGWQFLGYGEGFFFSNHCDNSVGGHMSLDPKFQRGTWWTNTPARKFTVLLYLNDQREDYAPGGTYSGGDLVLTRAFKNGERVKFQPKAGNLIAFPSNFLYSHEVWPVTRGYRFSCVTWVNLERA